MLVLTGWTISFEIVAVVACPKVPACASPSMYDYSPVRTIGRELIPHISLYVVN